MEEYIAFDSHKHYTWVEQEPVKGGKARCYRVEHTPGAIEQALRGCRAGTPVARHLAEATDYVLRRHEDYRDPTLGRTREV